MRGAGTSVITLAIPPHTAVSLVTKMLHEEAAAATQIKSRVNRQSVQDALTAALHQVAALGHRTDGMGRFVFCGEVLTQVCGRVCAGVCIYVCVHVCA